MKAVNAILATLLVLVVIVGLSFGAWKLGWILNSANTNQQTRIDQQNYGSQLAYVRKVQNAEVDVATIKSQELAPGITAAEKSALTTQANAIAQQACGVATLITTPASDIQQFVATYCTGGTQ